MNRSTLSAAAFLALAIPLGAAASKPTALNLSTTYTVDQFTKDIVLRQRVLTACANNPGELHNDPNCINAVASHMGPAREEDHTLAARRLAAAQDIASITLALDLYRLDSGAYPSQKQTLSALVAKPTTAPMPAKWQAGGYLERMPMDPWGRPYLYLNPGVHGEVDVYSMGAGGPDWMNEPWSMVGSWQPEAAKARDKMMGK